MFSELLPLCQCSSTWQEVFARHICFTEGIERSRTSQVACVVCCSGILPSLFSLVRYEHSLYAWRCCGRFLCELYAKRAHALRYERRDGFGERFVSMESQGDKGFVCIQPFPLPDKDVSS